MASVKTKAQHGRHVGRDHARALGDAVDGDLDAIDHRGGGGGLGIGVGGHDGVGGGAPVAGRALRHQPSQHAGDLLGRQRLADHPGRGHEDFLRPAAGRGGGLVGDGAHALLPGLAGKGVGIAAVDHQHPRLARL